jgi:uncharacterized LabA/DUF88 family protein
MPTTIKKVAILVDGGYLRAISTKASKKYDPDFIEKFAHGCQASDEEIFRILYYDCAPFNGTAKLPVSGTVHTFKGSDQWLIDLSKRELFAVRKGVLKFRGYKPKQIPVAAGATPQDSDFEPDFEQKGVDMRIGLDIGVYSENRAVNRIVLISNDTDCIPALKHARRAGLQMVIIELPGCSIAPELVSHTDYKRAVSWP